MPPVQKLIFISFYTNFYTKKGRNFFLEISSFNYYLYFLLVLQLIKVFLNLVGCSLKLFTFT